MQAITEKLTANNLKELRSYLGAVKQLNRIIPNLTQLCHDLRPLLKKDQPWKWEEKHDKAIQNINEKVKQVAEVGHFKKKLSSELFAMPANPDWGQSCNRTMEIFGAQYNSHHVF